jgi:hypothetical protein
LVTLYLVKLRIFLGGTSKSSFGCPNVYLDIPNAKS